MPDTLHQIGIVADRLADRAKIARLLSFSLKVVATETLLHRIHRHPGQRHLLMQRNTQLLVRLQQLGIDFVQRLFQGRVLGRGIIIGGLVIDLGIMHPRPFGLGHRLPALERAQPPFQHPFRLALLGRNIVHRVFRQALGGRSISISVTKPYLYFSPSSATCSWFRRRCSSATFPVGARWRNFSSD